MVLSLEDVTKYKKCDALVCIHTVWSMCAQIDSDKSFSAQFSRGHAESKSMRTARHQEISSARRIAFLARYLSKESAIEREMRIESPISPMQIQRVHLIRRRVHFLAMWEIYRREFHCVCVIKWFIFTLCTNTHKEKAARTKRSGERESPCVCVCVCNAVHFLAWNAANMGVCADSLPYLITSN